MAKKQKLKELSPAQLERRVVELQEELRDLRFKQVVATIDSPADMIKLRRDIARAKTYIREYELGLFKYEELRRVPVEQKPKSKNGK